MNRRTPAQVLTERRAYLLGQAEHKAEESKRLLHDAAKCIADEQSCIAQAAELAIAIEELS